MCPKIWCDRESEKFCKIFWELNRASVWLQQPKHDGALGFRGRHPETGAANPSRSSSGELALSSNSWSRFFESSDFVGRFARSSETWRFYLQGGLFWFPKLPPLSLLPSWAVACLLPAETVDHWNSNVLCLLLCNWLTRLNFLLFE
jgi:hypothetical protein